MKNKVYTIREAVYDTISSFNWDEPFKCVDFFTMCRWNLRKKGNPAHPFDGTLQREMRRIRNEFGIVCIDRARSIYMKKSDKANECEQ